MLTLLLAGCGTLAFLNEAPEVSFLSPDPGAVVVRSKAVTLVARVADDTDSIDALDYFLHGPDGGLIDADPQVNVDAGQVSLTVPAGLPGAEPKLTLRVVDQQGESASAVLTLSVVDNLPPVVTWVSPVQGGQYPAGQALSVEVVVTDPDPDADSDLALAWSGGALEGRMDLPAMLDASGTVRFEITGLASASWWLGLRATDSLLAAGSNTVAFTVAQGDQDDDGYLAEAVGGDDCDDGSAAVNPGASESCNERDDDCDGLIDEEATDAAVHYRDEDGDGFGNAADGFSSCAPLAGRVENDDDCDDTRADVNPAGLELCNGLDDDCDGDTDAAAADMVTVWLDFDEDTYGSGDPYEVCFPAVDEVFNDEDCDDGDDTVYPGAPELCDLGNDDEDCDGTAGNDDPDSTGTQTAYADADGDGFGDPAVELDLCSLEAGWVANADDCDDTDAYAFSGGAEVCDDGFDFDCDGFDGECVLSGTVALSAADYTLTGAAYAAAGTLVRSLVDLDGDGLNDFAVTSNYNDVALVRAATLASAPVANWPTLSGSGSDLFGYSLLATDDLDGDGVSELFVGAPFAGTDGGGAVYLFDPTGTADQGIADALGALEGAADEQFGLDLAGPFDLDGNGAAEELLVAGDGTLRVFDVALNELASWTLPSGADGSVLALAPDCDGDGLDDVLVGVSEADSAYLVYGGTSGDLDLSSADVFLPGTLAGDAAGTAVAGLGDATGDGYGDVAVGAPGSASDTTTNAGAVYVWTDLAGTPASTRLAGLVAGDRAGVGVGAAGDLDADGTADLLVGASGESTGGRDAGAVYVFYGTNAWAAWDFAAPDALFTGSGGSTAGESVTGLGDLNGDGADDLGIGAVRAGSLAAGAAYVVFGGSL